MNKSNFLGLKLVLTICFSSITLAIIVARKAVSTGYELSIYAQTPLLFWLALFSCIIGGIWLITNQAFSNEKRISLKLIITPLIFVHITILLLPMIRGYLLYGSPDNYIHVGIVEDIISSGHLYANNFYPAVHLVASQLSLVCNIPPTVTGQIFPVFLSVVFVILCMYLIGKDNLPKRGQLLFAFALFSGFLFNSLHTFIYPNMFGFLLLLMILYIWLNDSIHPRPTGKLTLVILISLVPFSHPAPSVIAIFFLLIVNLYPIIKTRTSGQISDIKVSFIFPLIAFVILYTWFSSFPFFDSVTRAIWFNVHEPIGEGYYHEEFKKTVDVLNETGNLITSSLKLYGDSIFVLSLAFLSIGILIIRQRFGLKVNEKLIVLIAIWLGMGFIELAILFVSVSQTVGRLLNLSYLILLSSLLAGFTLYELIRHLHRNIAIAISMIILILFWTTSVFGVYHSPWVLQPSWQITRMDIEGIRWIAQYKESEISFSGVGYPQHISYIALDHGSARTIEDQMGSSLPWSENFNGVLPIGFGYDQYPTLGQSLEEDSYLILTKRFKDAVANPSLSANGLIVIPQFFSRGYYPSDIQKLNQDPSINKLYSNGEWESFYIYGTD